MALGVRRPILGRLAELGWFSQSGEVAATYALSVLLEETVLRVAFLDWLGRRTATDLTSVTWLRTEHAHEDGTRFDIEGLDSDVQPLLVVEAKFNAPLTIHQVRSYLEHQARSLRGSTGGCFVLLVPETRVGEAESVLGAARQLEREGLPASRIADAVISWDRLMELLQDAVRDLPATAESLAADLVQMGALCRALSNLVIPPVNNEYWRDREEDLRKIIDQVTAQFSGSNGHGLPMVKGDGFYGPYRYFHSGYPARNSAASFGLAKGFSDRAETALWLRFHKRTPSFAKIRDRIMSSPFGEHARNDQGHLWLPIEVPPDAAGPALVAHLVAQIKRIQMGLAQAPTGSSPTREPGTD